MTAKRILLTALAVLFAPFVFAGGGNCIVTGMVQHVSTTETKIILIVSGESRVVTPKHDGYTTYPVDHGLFIIARREQPHSGDSEAWAALAQKAERLINKRAALVARFPDSINIESLQVFMVRCHISTYDNEGGTSSVELNEYPQR